MFMYLGYIFGLIIGLLGISLRTSTGNEIPSYN